MQCARSAGVDLRGGTADRADLEALVGGLVEDFLAVQAEEDVGAILAG